MSLPTWTQYQSMVAKDLDWRDRLDARRVARGEALSVTWLRRSLGLATTARLYGRAARYREVLAELGYDGSGRPLAVRNGGQS